MSPREELVGHGRGDRDGTPAAGATDGDRQRGDAGRARRSEESTVSPALDGDGKMDRAPIGASVWRASRVSREGWAPGTREGRGDRRRAWCAPRLLETRSHPPAASAESSRLRAAKARGKGRRERNGDIHVDHLGLHDPKPRRVCKSMCGRRSAPGRPERHACVALPSSTPAARRWVRQRLSTPSLTYPGLAAIRSRWTLGSALHFCRLRVRTGHGCSESNSFGKLL